MKECTEVLEMSKTQTLQTSPRERRSLSRELTLPSYLLDVLLYRFRVDTRLQRLKDELTKKVAENSSPAQILPHVWLGGVVDVESFFLNESSVEFTHLYDVASSANTETLGKWSMERQHVTRWELDCQDDDTFQIVDVFEEAFKCLDAVDDVGGKVLLHCQMGINRSGAIMIAYVCEKLKITLLSAARLVREARGNMWLVTNESFQRQLVGWAVAQGWWSEKEEDCIESGSAGALS